MGLDNPGTSTSNNTEPDEAHYQGVTSSVHHGNPYTPLDISEIEKETKDTLESIQQDDESGKTSDLDSISEQADELQSNTQNGGMS